MIINIPIEVPEALEAMNWIELYSRMYAGWTPTILVADEETGIVHEVDNISALDAGIAFKQKQLKDEFRQVMLQMGREQGEKQAIEQFNSLFPL